MATPAPAKAKGSGKATNSKAQQDLKRKHDKLNIAADIPCFFDSPLVEVVIKPLNSQSSGEFIGKVPTSSTTKYIHRAVLTAISPEFKVHINNKMREGLTNTLTIEEVSLSAVDRLFQWAYTGTYNSNSEERDDGLLLNAELFALAERFNVVKLQSLELQNMKEKLFNIKPTTDKDLSTREMEIVIQFTKYCFRNLPTENMGVVFKRLTSTNPSVYEQHRQEGDNIWSTVGTLEQKHNAYLKHIASGKHTNNKTFRNLTPPANVSVTECMTTLKAIQEWILKAISMGDSEITADFKESLTNTQRLLLCIIQFCAWALDELILHPNFYEEIIVESPLAAFLIMTKCEPPKLFTMPWEK